MSIRQRNLDLFEGCFGGLYALYMEHEAASRVIGRALWSADVRPYYASMRRIAAVSRGGLIVDAPCGAGVAFRGLAPEQAVRYVAVDLSQRMLDRARAVAKRRGLDRIELVRADATAIPRRGRLRAGRHGRRPVPVAGSGRAETGSVGGIRLLRVFLGNRRGLSACPI